MRALTISANGGLDRIEFRDDLPIPAIARPDDVRVRVQAGALNHLDLFVVRGLPRVTITPSWILGSDATGVVESVGGAVSGIEVGDTVVIDPGAGCGDCEYCRDGETPLCVRYSILGEHRPGVLAEYVVVPAGSVHRVPADVPVEARAALPLATLTAWRMIVTRARVRAGDDVLIWGIGGGVAQAALQISRLFGARTWVTSGDDDKLARARELGADFTLNHRTDDVVGEIRTRTAKRGMDVVIDNVGEATWSRSLGVLGRRGRLVTCGATSGPIVETDVRRLFWNQWTIMGSTMGNSAEFGAMVEEFRQGRLRPPVDSVFPLEEGRAAFERLAAGEQFGKIVLTV